MSLFRILARIKSEPWAITQEYMDTILAVAERETDPQAVAAKIGRDLENTYDVEYRDGVAILPVSGPLFRYANLFTQVSGASSYQMLARDFDKALNDPNVSAIVLSVDSPGGEANGVSEFADQIRAASGNKPVVAYVGGTAASAAYWLASAADQVVISDTAMLGSIGAVIGIQDAREREAKSGVKRYEIVSAQSPYKRLDPATEEGRSRIQARVDALAAVFVEKVAAYRDKDVDTVLKDFGQGDMLVGQAAVSAGLADRVGSFEGVIAELSGSDSEGFGIGIAAASGNTTEDGKVPHYLTTKAPAAGEEQRQMEATAENFARLCPEAADALRKEGADAKAEELQEQIASASQSAEESASAERERIKGIIGCDEAKGRESLAEHLAFNDDISVDKAKALLSAAPVAAKEQDKADPLSAAMAGEKEPEVGADGDQDDELEAAIARSQKLGAELGIE